MAHTIPPFIHHSPPFLCFSHHQPPPLPSSPPTITITHTPQGHCGHPLPTLLPHTHMVWVACGFVAALSCCEWVSGGCVVWMACTSHHFVLTHTQAHALWLCPSPHHHSIVCVLAITCHVCLVNHTTQSHALVFSLSSPVCAIHAFPIHRVCVRVRVVDWWLGCVGVGICVSG